MLSDELGGDELAERRVGQRRVGRVRFIRNSHPQPEHFEFQ